MRGILPKDYDFDIDWFDSNEVEVDCEDADLIECKGSLLLTSTLREYNE